MDNLVTYITLLGFIAFFIFIIAATNATKKRIPEELGLTPEIEEICGGMINFIVYSWPFIRHSIYKEFIVIKHLGNQYIIPRTDLKIKDLKDSIPASINYISDKYPGHEFRIWTTKKEAVLMELGAKS